MFFVPVFAIAATMMVMMVVVMVMIMVFATRFFILVELIIIYTPAIVPIVFFSLLS